MKKLVSVLLSVCVLCSFAILVNAATVAPSEGYTYYSILKNENVKFFEDDGTAIVVPDELEMVLHTEQPDSFRFGGSPPRICRKLITMALRCLKVLPKQVVCIRK